MPCGQRRAKQSQETSLSYSLHFFLEEPVENDVTQWSLSFSIHKQGWQ